MMNAAFILADAPPVPQSTDFAPWLIAAIIWTLAAAAIAAPLIRFLRPAPTNQLFAEDLIQPRK